MKSMWRVGNELMYIAKNGIRFAVTHSEIADLNSLLNDIEDRGNRLKRYDLDVVRVVQHSPGHEKTKAVLGRLKGITTKERWILSNTKEHAERVLTSWRRSHYTSRQMIWKEIEQINSDLFKLTWCHVGVA